MYHPRHTTPVHSRSFSVILLCSRYFLSPYYYILYLSPLLFHISILGSGRDELDRIIFYPFIVYVSVYLRAIFVNPVLIVYLHISPLGSSYCSPPYKVGAIRNQHPIM